MTGTVFEIKDGCPLGMPPLVDVQGNQRTYKIPREAVVPTARLVGRLGFSLLYNDYHMLISIRDDRQLANTRAVNARAAARGRLAWARQSFARAQAELARAEAEWQALANVRPVPLVSEGVEALAALCRTWPEVRSATVAWLYDVSPQMQRRYQPNRLGILIVFWPFAYGTHMSTPTMWFVAPDNEPIALRNGHPHVYADHEVCWGDAMFGLGYAATLDTLRRWLWTYDRFSLADPEWHRTAKDWWDAHQNTFFENCAAEGQTPMFMLANSDAPPTPKTLTTDGVKAWTISTICARCHSDTGNSEPCNICGTLVCIDCVRYVDDDGEYYCDECIEEYLCDACGVWITTLPRGAAYDPREYCCEFCDLMACPTCARHLSLVCEDCRGYVCRNCAVSTEPPRCAPCNARRKELTHASND